MSDKLSTNIAANLKRLREARQISQQRLSDVSGVPRPTLAHLESGSANPTLSVMLKVSEALQVRLETLLEQPVPAIAHHPASQLPTRTRGGSSVQRLIADAHAGLDFERVELKPQARWSVKPAVLGQRYHLYCESGEVLLAAAGDDCRLESGDLAVLGSETGFSVTNASRRIAIVFRVTGPALHGA